MQASTSPERSHRHSSTHTLVVRFAGDSGDGVQILGNEFSKGTAQLGQDILTFPDYPAEIRAPAGSVFGVSAFQIQFGGAEVLTAGDKADVLFAFNPAALKANLNRVKPGGLIILGEGAFTDRNLARAGYTGNPLEDPALKQFRLLPIDITRLTAEAVKQTGVTSKQAGRSKNFWSLGLCFWMFGGDPGRTLLWIDEKFSAQPEIAAANQAALKAGYAYGETMEISAGTASTTEQETLPAGRYRTITGIDAAALGITAVAALSGQKLVYCSYPITPASNLLHHLASLEGQGVVTFQAEDEIAAVTAAIGASYGGALGVTGSSGPGLALKTEGLGLAVAAELPLLVVDVQRAGPSTGMPTKPEQGDLHLALYARHGEAPCPVLAAATPADCFHVMITAADVAMRFMTPVIVLLDAYLANAAEPWLLPDVETLDDITPTFRQDPEGYAPFQRDSKTLARSWVKPGTPGLESRLGGLERADGSGDISYDPENHQKMSDLRAAKVQRVADYLDPAVLDSGDSQGELLVIGWGSTYGAVRQAVENLRDAGASIGHCHLTLLWPLPGNLEKLIRAYTRIAVVEMNEGQLVRLIRSEFLVDAKPINQITGQPFHVDLLTAKLSEHLNSPSAEPGSGMPSDQQTGKEARR